MVIADLWWANRAFWFVWFAQFTDICDIRSCKLGKLQRSIRFDSWFARFALQAWDLLCKFAEWIGRIGTNISCIQIYICLNQMNQANQTNVYLYICNICLIRPADWWSIRLIHSIFSRSWFDLPNSNDMICPIRPFLKQMTPVRVRYGPVRMW